MTSDSDSNPLVSQDYVAKFFQAKGVPDAVAHGWARRIVVGESGGNPLAVNPISGAIGLYQALGPRKASLLADPNWKDPNTQLEHLWSEMHGGDPQSTMALPAMLAANNEQTAYNLFTHNVERPGAQGGDMLARGGAMGRALQTYGMRGPTPSGPFDISSMMHPIAAPQVPQAPQAPENPVTAAANEAATQPGAAPQGTPPQIGISILAAMMNRTHKFTPISYDPYAVKPNYSAFIPIDHDPFEGTS